MNDMERRLAAALRSRAEQAVPDSDPRPKLVIGRSRARKLRRWGVPVAAAATVLAAILIPFAVMSGGGTPKPLGTAVVAGPESCPAGVPDAVDPWVPDLPSVPGATRSLIPAGVSPQVVIICSYGTDSHPIAADGRISLSARTIVTGPFGALTAALASLPDESRRDSNAGCPNSSLSSERYLVGIRFPTGSAWVGTLPGGCPVATSNGVFKSDGALTAQIRQAVRGGKWPSR